MVWFSERFVARYSMYSRFILTELPKMRSNGRIFIALISAAGIRSGTPPIRVPLVAEKVGKAGQPIRMAMAGLALGKGTPPRIVSRELPRDIGGRFDVNWPDRIEVNRVHIRWFHADPTSPHMQHFVLATVLHEIVHYLDFQDDSLRDSDVIYDPTLGTKFTVLKPWARDLGLDMGDIFEVMAFGGKANP